MSEPTESDDARAARDLAAWIMARCGKEVFVKTLAPGGQNLLVLSYPDDTSPEDRVCLERAAQAATGLLEAASGNPVRWLVMPQRFQAEVLGQGMTHGSGPGDGVVSQEDHGNHVALAFVPNGEGRP